MNSRPLIYLAPFQGITGSVYREVYTTYFQGIDKLFTPFFTGIHSTKSIAAKIGELDRTSHHNIPVIPQVLSNDAEEIVRFNHICRELGFDEVNWNLGCPFRRVAAKKRGSGLMQYPDMVRDILTTVMQDVPLKFSIKCRLGYESDAEIDEMIQVFNEFPLSELIVHARIGRQIYKGDVNIEAFAKLSESTDIPLVYNGDIFSVSSYKKLSKRFSSNDPLMIGRGLLADPFLPGDIKNNSKLIHLDERKRYLKKFVDELYYQYRKKLNDRLHAISLMKELWEYMSFGFDQPSKVFGKIKKTKTFDAYEDSVNLVFNTFDWVGSGAESFDSSMM